MIPFRRALFAGTAPAFSLTSLSPGASARAVPAEVAACTPSTCTIHRLKCGLARSRTILYNSSY
ncbi:hypothetical protein DEX24_05995 [Kurthia sibirica]|uniref:Uncharacterized protein n=1 Tax=Kurthia sibirica TaxID=202750 RepID=A0A2U3AMK9_9BACL|nr:hypothetical protein DEX24_05995 [Kurthia sibirica]